MKLNLFSTGAVFSAMFFSLASNAQEHQLEPADALPAPIDQNYFLRSLKQESESFISEEGILRNSDKLSNIFAAKEDSPNFCNRLALYEKFNDICTTVEESRLVFKVIQPLYFEQDSRFLVGLINTIGIYLAKASSEFVGFSESLENEYGDNQSDVYDSFLDSKRTELLRVLGSLPYGVLAAWSVLDDYKKGMSTHHLIQRLRRDFDNQLRTFEQSIRFNPKTKLFYLEQDNGPSFRQSFIETNVPLGLPVPEGASTRAGSAQSSLGMKATLLRGAAKAVQNQDLRQWFSRSAVGKPLGSFLQKASASLPNQLKTSGSFVLQKLSSGSQTWASPLSNVVNSLTKLKPSVDVARAAEAAITKPKQGPLAALLGQLFGGKPKNAGPALNQGFVHPRGAVQAFPWHSILELPQSLLTSISINAIENSFAQRLESYNMSPACAKLTARTATIPLYWLTDGVYGGAAKLNAAGFLLDSSRVAFDALDCAKDIQAHFSKTNQTGNAQ